MGFIDDIEGLANALLPAPKSTSVITPEHPEVVKAQRILQAKIDGPDSGLIGGIELETADTTPPFVRLVFPYTISNRLTARVIPGGKEFVYPKGFGNNPSVSLQVTLGQTVLRNIPPGTRIPVEFKNGLVQVDPSSPIPSDSYAYDVVPVSYTFTCFVLDNAGKVLWPDLGTHDGSSTAALQNDPQLVNSLLNIPDVQTQGFSVEGKLGFRAYLWANGGGASFNGTGTVRIWRYQDTVNAALIAAGQASAIVQWSLINDIELSMNGTSGRQYVSFGDIPIAVSSGRLFIEARSVGSAAATGISVLYETWG